MNILQHLQEIVKTNFLNTLGSLNINPISSITTPYSINAYKNLITNFDLFINSLTKDSYMALISHLDDEFFNSTERIINYESKGFTTKILLTLFGEIQLKRRRYKNKITNKSFKFIDEFLGLSNYSRIDSFVKAAIIEKSSFNSYAKAGRLVSEFIGLRYKNNEEPTKNILSRATTRNIVIKQDIDDIDNQVTTNNVDTLYVMLDEKFVGSQFNDGKDFMVKACVVFEGSNHIAKNRNELFGKRVLASIEDDLLKQILDYIYQKYDTDILKKIIFMGDAALWIKNFPKSSWFKFNKDTEIIFALDGFHFAQAIQHIATNKYKNFIPILKEYAISNMKEEFTLICESIIKEEPHRESTIREKMEYLFNNWDGIQTYFTKISMKCSMESNISHVFADLLTSRPKAYSKTGLIQLLKLRLLKINGYDIQEEYFKSFNTNKNDYNLPLSFDEITNISSSNIPIINSNINSTSTEIRNLLNDCNQYIKFDNTYYNRKSVFLLT